MFCSECGKELRDGALFCPGCGCKVTQAETEEKVSFEFKDTTEVSPEATDNKKKMITIGAIAAGAIVCILVVIFFVLPKGDSSLADGEENILATETEAESTNADVLSAYYNDTIMEETPELNIGDRGILYTYEGIELVNDAPHMQAGVVAHKIGDFDRDGEEELLTIYSDGSEYYIAVYEVENEAVVKKSEIHMAHVSYYFPSILTGNMSLINRDNEIYILYTHQETDAIINGYCAELFLWKYNGTSIVPVMDIIQTEGGSSEFEYTARHYDVAGNIVESNVFHRESFDEAMRISDQDGSVMASQFSKYSITIKPNMSMFEDLENILADSVDKEQLYRLDIWVSTNYSMEDDMQITVYFNDTNKEYHKFSEAYRNALSTHVQNGTAVTYGYYDMNNDGFEELVVKNKKDDYVIAVYSYIDGSLQRVPFLAEEAYPYTYRLINNGLLAEVYYPGDDGGANAMVILCFDGTKFVEGTVFYHNYENYHTFSITENGKTSLVDGDEFNEKLEQSKGAKPDVTWYDLTNVSNIQLPKQPSAFTRNEISNATDYVLPNSNVVYLTKSDLAGLTAEQCRIARNEIYARHGRIFTDEALKTYFESKSWYHGTIQSNDFSESVLNEYEIANRDLITQYEEEQGYR